MPYQRVYVAVEGAVVVSSEALKSVHSIVPTRTKAQSKRAGFGRVRSETVMITEPPLLLAQNRFREIQEDERMVSCLRAFP
jgi:hypothetical protein